MTNTTKVSEPRLLSELFSSANLSRVCRASLSYGGGSGSGCVPLNQTIASHKSESTSAQPMPADKLNKAARPKSVPNSCVGALLAMVLRDPSIAFVLSSGE